MKLNILYPSSTSVNIKMSLWFFLFFILVFCLFFVTACKKKSEPIPLLETGTVADIEGNVYKTIKIGNRWWMAENLKVKQYNDSSFITHLQMDANQWQKDSLGAYCIFDNSTNAPGLLYNWYAVNNSKKLAPQGWHIPNDEEWKELEKQLGMSALDVEKTSWRGNHEGEKLKIEAPLGWTKYGDVWATNESGFTALGGSCRLFNGTWGQPGLSSTGFWWSSSIESSSNQAWYRHLDYKNANVFRYYGPKNYGFSVRCAKN